MFEAPDTVIDLTHPLEAGMPVWPSFPEVECRLTSVAARDGFTMERVEMNTHTGTHLDAPLHFVPEGRTLDTFPIETFMGDGVVVDLTEKEPEEAITVEDIAQFEADIEDDDVVMIDTGWDEYYGHTPEYMFEYPYLLGETAQYLVELNVKAVGIDTPSVAGWDGEVPAHGPVSDESGDAAHLPLLENDIIPVEELRNLGRVRDGASTRRAFFCFFPLNLQGTGGSPVRAVAFR